MQVSFWGTRGSLATPGPDTTRYGGNTSCVQVTGEQGWTLVLDAGTGIRLLGNALPQTLRRIDLLLTHLHMDHIQGLGFFKPLYEEGMDIHIWGPASTTQNLRERLARYLSPPLFPVRLRDLPCKLTLHEVPCGESAIGPFKVSAALLCHPGPTVGYRISTDAGTMAYLPDHEPVLGMKRLCLPGEWTSGFALAHGADLLLHDAQYTDEEYLSRVGWGHSSVTDAFAFAVMSQTRHLVPFHHDPEHSDEFLDVLFAQAAERTRPQFKLTPAQENATIVVGNS
ncbi:MAG: MBL fold metallo-hydrolase [Burkholderiales bacterium]